MAKAYPSKPFNSQNLVQKLFNLITTRAKVWKATKENVLNLKNANELKSLDHQFLENVTSTINSNIQNYDLNIEQLATEFGYKVGVTSPNFFYIIFCENI
jgi:transcription termination factor NusB